MMKKIYLGVFTFILLLGCADNNASNDDSKKEVKKETTTTKPKLDDDLVSTIIKSIPSPIEISFIVKEVEKNYRKQDLNDYAAVSRYNTNYKKALNLGVYGTDLGFANIYGKNQDALDYLNSVKKLADGLSIGQFFDFNTIRKLAESSSNLDELLLETTSNFEKINRHLREQKRESLSILLLAGGWVEATYLTTLVYNRTKHATLKEKIGEQKLVLDQILLVLDIYKTRPRFSELIADLTQLQNVYDKIEIETVYGEPTMVEKDGQLVVVDNNKSTIKMTDADLQSISDLIKKIRSNVVK